MRRTESLRKKGKKPNGGQPGHEGNTLNPSKTPEVTETHQAENGGECGASLKKVEVADPEDRPVFDIQAIRIEVAAHRAEIKICPACGATNRGEFPEGVTRAVPYGNGVKTWAAYFTPQHFVPLERTAQRFEDLVQHRVSEAVVLKAGEELSAGVPPATDEVKKQ